MIAVYIAAVLFTLWLATMLYRLRREAFFYGETGTGTGEASGAARPGSGENRGFNAASGVTTWDGGGGGAVPGRLVVLLQDQAGCVEGFVYRLAAFLQRRNGLRVALVDGGSADETGFILERLARRYNMEFHRLAVGNPLLDGVAVPGRPEEDVCRLDLRGLSAGALLAFDLHRAAGGPESGE